MKQVIEKVWRAIRHNHSLVVAVVACVLISYWIYGCQSQVESMRTPGKKVTRPELKIEVDTFLAQANVKFEDLDRQDAFKQELVKYALVLAEGGTVNPVGVITGLSAILGLGAIADNRRKDGVIKGLKKNA